MTKGASHLALCRHSSGNRLSISACGYKDSFLVNFCVALQPYGVQPHTCTIIGRRPSFAGGEALSLSEARRAAFLTTISHRIFEIWSLCVFTVASTLSILCSQSRMLPLPSSMRLLSCVPMSFTSSLSAMPFIIFVIRASNSAMVPGLSLIVVGVDFHLVAPGDSPAWGVGAGTIQRFVLEEVEIGGFQRRACFRRALQVAPAALRVPGPSELDAEEVGGR